MWEQMRCSGAFIDRLSLHLRIYFIPNKIHFVPNKPSEEILEIQCEESERMFYI
jgi:hypothetical protein